MLPGPRSCGFPGVVLSLPEKEEKILNICIDTCVFPRGRLETGRSYRETFGPELGFELLAMFDLPDFESNLERNRDLFAGGPLIFHEPVWGVEHAAARGSTAYDESMRHLRLTRKWARILQPAAMVCHLSNGPVPPGERDSMLKTALENLEEIREMFEGVQILVENTGIHADGTLLLEQDAFTDLCLSRDLPVLIDTGHANANGWNLKKLIRDLQSRIGGYHLHNNDGVHDLHNRLRSGTLDFSELLPLIAEATPDVPLVIEYTRPELCGEALEEDIWYLSGQIGQADCRSAKPREGRPGAIPDMQAERLHYFFTQTDDAVCATRRNGELVFANPAAEKLFGLESGTGKKLWESIPLVPENDKLIQLFINGIMKKEKNFRALVDYVNREGTSFHLHVSLTCESEESGLFLIVASDLTRLIRVHSAFERYTTPEIADYVLTAPGGEEQGGEDREVSILMSDLRGFTSLSTHLASADLIPMLNHYFECMSAVIERFRGNVIEFLGDGIFVVFGAPKELPDHARSAVACAIEMQNAMEEVNAWNRERGYPGLEMGIGVHSGVAAVGNIGSKKKMKYGCMGEAVNLAGRLESYTVGGQIYVSESTRAKIPEQLGIAGEKSFMPKGAREKMKYYDVTGLGPELRLHSAGAAEAWMELDRAAPLSFYKLEGKTVVMERQTGRIPRISADGRFGMLLSESPLEPLQDLMFRVGSVDVYAKVVDAGEKEYRLCFTSKPDDLAGLLSGNPPAAQDQPEP